MKKLLPILILAACAPAGAWAATYSYTGDPYTAPTLQNYTNCTQGSCGNFTTAMNQTGWFTTAAPLPANLSDVDITALITAFSFSDGLTTYSSAAGDTLYRGWADTTASGTFTDARLVLIHWQAPAPHAVGDRVDMLFLHQGGLHNYDCTQVTGNVCNQPLPDAASSNIQNAPFTSGIWAVTGVPAAPAAQVVPADNPFALTLTAAGLLGLALRMRRKQTGRSLQKP